MSIEFLADAGRRFVKLNPLGPGKELKVRLTQPEIEALKKTVQGVREQNLPKTLTEKY